MEAELKLGKTRSQSRTYSLQDSVESSEVSDNTVVKKSMAGRGKGASSKPYVDEDRDKPVTSKDIKEVLDSLLGVHRKLDTLHDAIYDPDVGVAPRVGRLEDSAQDMNLRVETLETENRALKRDLKLIKGMLQKQHCETKNLSRRVLDQTARSMKQNLTINELIQSDDEDCKVVVKEFFKDLLGVKADSKDIYVAHRLGSTGNSPTMVVKLEWNLRESVMKNVGKLKDRKNSKNQGYYISEQLPDGIVEGKKAASALAKEIKEHNKSLTKDQQVKVSQRQDKLYLNGELVQPIITPPEPKELFADVDEQDRMDKMRFTTTRSQGESGSLFWGSITKIQNVADAKRAYRKVRQLHPEKDKVSMAFCVEERGKLVTGSADDSEHGAGYKILQTIKDNELSGVALFVIRQYGGIHLGKKRFKHICEVSQGAIDAFELAHS